MKKIWKEWGWAAFVGLAVLLLALGLRLYKLTLLPVFADEAIYIRWSQIMVNEPTLRFLPLSDGKQPLFMWVLMFAVKHFSDPLFIGRLVSVFTGIGTMIGIFALSYILFKNKLVSLVSSFIYAVSPYMLFFDRMALVDSMLTFWGVWTLFFGVLTVKTRRFDFALLTGFTLGFASLTKSPSIFFALLLPTTWILASWPSKLKQKVVIAFKLGFLLLSSYILAFMMYNILRLGPNFGALTSRTLDYVFPISHLWMNPKDPFLPYFDRAFEWIRIMGPWVLLLLGGLGIILNLKKYRNELLFLFICFLAPILIQSEFAKVFTARYILFTLPYLIILAATFFLGEKKKILNGLGYLLLIIFVVQSLIFDYFLFTDPAKANLPQSERSGYLEEWTSGTGIKEVADYLEEYQNKNPKEKIVVGTEGYFGTLPDGLQMYLTDNPEITVIGVGVDIKEIPQSLIESREAGNKTFLVINKSRLHEDPEKLDLTLIAVYPKALRSDDTREYYTKGPQEALYFFELTRI